MFGKYKVNLKAITPVFIANGKSYTHSEFLSGRAKSGEKILDTISRYDLFDYYKELPEERTEEFIQKLSKQNFNLQVFDNKIDKKHRRYMSINRSGNVHLSEIQEAIKTMDELYIPGSSIKGSIRSVLMYNNIDSSNIPNNIINNRRINSRAYNQMENNFFSAKKGNSAQTSIMKYLQISDTTTSKQPEIHDLVTIKATPTGNYEEHSKHKGKTIHTYAETIGQGKKLSFTLNNEVHDDVLQRLGIPNKKHLISLKNIKESIYNFSSDLLEHEIDFARKYRHNDLLKNYKSIAKFNDPDAPLLKIGSGSGFLATTLGLKIKKENNYLYEQIRQSFRRSYQYEFPKSRKITAKGRPLGWVKLDFEKL